MTPFERSLSKLSIKSLIWIYGSQVMAAERVHEPLIKRGVVTVVNLTCSAV